MMVFGVASLGTRIFELSHIPAHPLSSSSILLLLSSYYFLRQNLIVLVSTVILFTGGIFCLRRKYWGFCLVSAVLLLLIMFFTWAGVISRLVWLDWYFVAPVVILVTVYVCLTRREWQKSQA